MDRVRRTLLAGFASLLVPSLGTAQEPGRTYRVAFVVFQVFSATSTFGVAARERLAERGFVQGRNLDFRYIGWRVGDAAQESDKNRRVLEEISAWRPDVVLVGSTRTIAIVREAKLGVPVVFANAQDPLASGLVTNLARPGGNMTGAALPYHDLTIKRLELVREVLPAARRVAIVMDSRSGGLPPRIAQEVRSVAGGLNLSVHELDVASIATGLCGVARRVREARAEAILTWGNINQPSLYRVEKSWGSAGYGECLATLQRESRVPVIDDSLDTVKSGSAFALGEDQHDSYRRAADVVAKILAGAKPGDVPVDMQMRVQLFINAASVRALGISLPQSVLLRADRVVE